MNITILVIYLLMQFGICYWVGKQIQSQDDYLVGGRNLPMYLVTFSLFATWFGAETCIGSSAMVYEFGLSGSRADPFGYSLCLVLSGLLIAPRLWNKKFVTLADFYAERFGTHTEQIATWLLSISSLIWAAAQLRAFAQIVAVTTDLPVDLTLFLSFTFVVTYTVMGGLLGDIITDLIQGVVIMLGLIVLLCFVARGELSIGEMISTQTPERLSLLGQGESWLQRIDRWAIPIFGSLIAQEIVARLFAARSKEVAVKSCFASGLIYLFVGSIPVFLGLVGPQLIEVGADKEQFLLALAEKYLPWYIVPIFAGALISALLATIDSILLSCGGLISNNVVIPMFKIKSDLAKVRLSRGLVLGTGIFAYVLAVYSDSIYQLVEAGSSFGTSGILVITLFGLWTPLGHKTAASLTLVVGLVTTPIAEYILNWPSPFLTSLTASILVYLLASLFFANRTRSNPRPQQHELRREPTSPF
jgi:Na+/proline symporter